MSKKAIFTSILLLALCCLLFSGCNRQQENSEAAGPIRDNTPNVLVPEASGTITYGSDTITLDASHTDKGYLMVLYKGNNAKVKLQLNAPSGTTYTYLLAARGTYETFPYSSGDGTYSVSVLENTTGDMYSIAFAQNIDVRIADEFTPFLYPNQYVNFTKDSAAIKKGIELTDGIYSDLEAVSNIYHFVIKNIDYDQKKATSVSYGYLPNVDETLKTKKGICFDYAALMSAMLRSQGIPTKLEVGYAGEAYHAWISTYIDGKGWVDDIIQFDGISWELMDPTFAASDDSQSFRDTIGDGTNYVLKYSY